MKRKLRFYLKGFYILVFGLFGLVKYGLYMYIYFKIKIYVYIHI